MQALGGYGYINEYEVEKIRRDIKITTIYEGTSEIQQNIISTFRWKSTRKTKGAFYRDIGDDMLELEKELGTPLLAFSCRDLQPADLSEEQLDKIKALETRLGMSLVAVTA